MMPSAHGCVRAIDRAATGVFAAVAITLVVVLAGSFAGYHLLVDVSDSMRPALRAGDLLVTERVPASLIGRGDIVTFVDRPRGRLVTHRVIAIKRTGRSILFTTRGDANPASETWRTTSASTVRRVSTRVPFLGRALARLGAIPVPVLMICVAVLLPALVLRRRRRTPA